MFNDVDENLEYVIRKERILALRETDEWAEFAERFDTKSDSNLSLLAELFEDKLGDDPSVEDYQRLIRNVLLAGGVVRIGGERYEFDAIPKPEQVVEPEVPRDKNGNALSASQIAWGEMTRWSQTASSRQIDDRRRSDPAYASFHRKNLEREMAETAVGDGAQNLNSPVKRNEAVASDLVREFAKLHRELPAERLRPKGGYIVLSESMRLTKQQFDDLVEKSTQAGLL